MRQKTRRILLVVSLLLFVMTMNYFSPYVVIDGALSGIVTGSLITFSLMFLTSLFLGRAWCAWLCPMGGLAEILLPVNPKKVNAKRLRIVRYSVFGLWFSILCASFVVAGGIKGINLLHLTERGVSVDEPIKYITYLLVVLVFFALTILIGRRGACHGICWMSPFMEAGSKISEAMKLPRLRVVSEPDKCIACHRCDAVCPMSIQVSEAMKQGSIRSTDCIQCANCVDECPKSLLQLKINRK